MTTTVVAGLDVGKDEVHVHANGLGRSYANVPTGFRGLRNWLSQQGVQRVVMEPTVDAEIIGQFRGAFRRFSSVGVRQWLA